MSRRHCDGRRRRPRRLAGARTGSSQMRMAAALRRVRSAAHARRSPATTTLVFGLVGAAPAGVRADQAGPAVEAIAARAAHKRRRGRRRRVRRRRPTDRRQLLSAIRDNGGGGRPHDGNDGAASSILLIACTKVGALLAVSVSRADARSHAARVGAARRRDRSTARDETLILAIAAGRSGSSSSRSSSVCSMPAFPTSRSRSTGAVYVDVRPGSRGWFALGLSPALPRFGWRCRRR